MRKRAERLNLRKIGNTGRGRCRMLAKEANHSAVYKKKLTYFLWESCKQKEGGGGSGITGGNGRNIEGNGKKEETGGGKAEIKV